MFLDPMKAIIDPTILHCAPLTIDTPLPNMPTSIAVWWFRQPTSERIPRHRPTTWLHVSKLGGLWLERHLGWLWQKLRLLEGALCWLLKW